MKLESVILNDFFLLLNRINANYCVMNNYNNMPEIIPSDVDIAVDMKTYNMLDSLVEYLAKRHKVSITQKIWHGYYKCAYILSPIDIVDYFWLQLDFFVDFSGKGFPNLFPNSEMLNNKRKYKNFYIPTIRVEIPFILERRIFKNDIEEKHIDILFNLYQINPKEAENGVFKVFGPEDGQLLIKCIKHKDINTFKNNFKTLRKQLQGISKKNTNILYRIKYIFWQGVRTLYRLLYPTGLSIVFIGKDDLVKKEIIKVFNEKISGSFHGEKFYNPKSFFEYVYLAFNDFWARVTKKKTLWNIDNRVLFNKKISYFIYQDVIIALNLEQDVIKNSQMAKHCLCIDSCTLLTNKDKVIQQCLAYSLKKQVQNTSKHLYSKLSPTSRKVLYEEK